VSTHVHRAHNSYRRRVADRGNGLLGNLVAYWPGDEASGDLLDAHTNGLDLADAATVTSAAGKVYATGRQYTAANSEYHWRASETLLQMGDNDFTIATWVYLTDKLASRLLVSKEIASAREYSLLYLSTADVFRVLFGDGSTSLIVARNATSFGSPSVATWHLIVAWHDSVKNIGAIQVNDGAVDSSPTIGAGATTSTAFHIGSGPVPSLYHNGRLGPTAMWKSAGSEGGVLTAKQRSALWNRGLGLPYSGFTS
jgi:hypothetical protein